MLCTAIFDLGIKQPCSTSSQSIVTFISEEDIVQPFTILRDSDLLLVFIAVDPQIGENREEEKGHGIHGWCCQCRNQES